MAKVLVTGGTGMLGRQLVPRLVQRGHDVRVLSRKPAAHLPEEASWLQGDVLDQGGIRAAVSGMDVVVHAASSPARKARRTEVDGTAHVVDALSGTRAHIIYVSIVGVDRHRFPYYRAKLAAERVVESSQSTWTIQRATQFHDLMDLFLGYPVLPVTQNMRFQPVDAGEVADRLADLVEGGGSGHAPDFGGPEVMPIRELADIRRRETGRRARLIRLPALGFLRDFDDGKHLCPDNRSGRRTWLEWLRDGR
jgi:uncharacterized protein YbjT (DUF2867 family)